MITLYNTLTNCKEIFIPLDRNNIKLYICGPTVYGLMHIGNARSVIIYDVLFRMLKLLYKKVTYVRNITDVDDKIINIAKDKEVSISEITCYYIKQFHDDLRVLNCLKPTFEPRATDNIEVIIDIIARLLDLKHAYIKNNAVYFDVSSYSMYGALSNRKVDDLIYGNRVKINPEKNHLEDFILWKPATDDDRKHMSCWLSPWGMGRPGWHIECSAMSYAYLGESFDIHGGGIDLQFPHHENELAQSRCAFPKGNFAKYWLHNGLLTIDNQKMSKSLGNLLTVRKLTDEGIKGEVIRFALLMTHYRKPLLWNSEILKESKKSLDRFYNALKNANFINKNDGVGENNIPDELLGCLNDDINVPKAISVLHDITTKINKEKDQLRKSYLCEQLIRSGNLLGVLQCNFNDWFSTCNEQYVEELINKRKEARERKDFIVADKIRQQLIDNNIIVSDNKDGSITWYKK